MRKIIPKKEFELLENDFDMDKITNMKYFYETNKFTSERKRSPYQRDALKIVLLIEEHYPEYKI
jgi:hypothetical protein